MLLATLVSLAGNTSSLPRPRSRITAAFHGPIPLIRRRTAAASGDSSRNGILCTLQSASPLLRPSYLRKRLVQLVFGDVPLVDEGYLSPVYLVENDSDVLPDTIHADTQGQSAAIFGLAHLL